MVARLANDTKCTGNHILFNLTKITTREYIGSTDEVWNSGLKLGENTFNVIIMVDFVSIKYQDYVRD